MSVESPATPLLFPEPTISLDSHATDLLYAPVETENGHVSAIELAERYYGSPYAEFMDDLQPLRFSGPYGYDHAHMIEDLGQNVLPVGHQLETGLFVAWYLAHRHQVYGDYGLPEEEIGPLLFGALTHDSGETVEPSIVAETGMAIGDVPYGCKTPEQRVGEALNRRAVDRRVFPDVRPVVLEYKERIILHQDMTGAHEAFVDGHDLADFNTGLFAGSVALRELNLLRTEPGLMTRNLFEIAQLTRLASNVWQTMAPRLLDVADRLQLAQ